jgi:hypothetical protein
MFMEGERQKQGRRLNCSQANSCQCFPRSRLSRSKNLFRKWFNEKERVENDFPTQLPTLFL